METPHPPAVKRLRRKRRRRRVMIRGVYFLPSLCTLGNALCGFAAMYVATLDPATQTDPMATLFADYRFLAASYLIALAMVFDALDGRLARITRHTTDFGGQLDSLCDAISFGAAPAFIILQVFKEYAGDLPLIVSRMVFACGLLFMACAVLRLARFNVTNEHDEQHHFSFVGLPTPAAAGAVLGLVLVQQDLLYEASYFGGQVGGVLTIIANVIVGVLPIALAGFGLLMVSEFKYPHVVNRLLRGRKSLAWLVVAVAIVALLIVQHRYVLAVAGLAVGLSGPVSWLWARRGKRRRQRLSAAA
jgi:CDP-diacylglycerol--serine O-phosphatidyltransferase